MKYLKSSLILAVVLFLATPIQVRANSLSYIPPEEADGIPAEVKEIAEIVGAEFNICPELLEAMAFKESSYKAGVKNGSCSGLMQINTKIHRDRFIEMGWDSNDWRDPYKNMYVAADYLADLFNEYEDVTLVLYLYNGDTKNLKRYRESGYLSRYVESILEKSAELERLHGK